jgi:hypothetical protein
VTDALERLRQANRREEKLDNGIIVGYHLPDVRECLLAGYVPLPALEHLPAGATEKDAERIVGEEKAMELAKEDHAFKRRILAAMLDDIDGRILEADDDRDAIVAAFTPSQREILLNLATREKDPNSGEA